MGFKRPGKTYLLQFEGELEGLEVRAKGASVAQIVDLMELSRLADGFTAENIKDLEGMIDLFASKIIEWNLEDEDGNPITFEPVEFLDRRETPAEAKARVLREQDMDLVMPMIYAWMEGVIGTPAPLDEKSSDGVQSEEALIPMEVSSESLPV